jgi:hypothetical protein
MTHPIPDRFRVNEVWASPRGVYYTVISVDPGRLPIRRVKLKNTFTGSFLYKAEQAIGDNMMNAWLRIDPPHEANP